MGERIVKEFGLENGVDTLARWMAHRVAELMERAEQAQTDADRETARRECADLILRLWERRSYWPQGRPLAEVSEFLKKFTDGLASFPYNRAKTQPKEPTWINILPHLIRLNKREEIIYRDAALADLSLEKEREWLAEHREDMSDEECEVIERLLALRERLEGPYYFLDDDPIPNFTALSAQERTARVLEALDKINAERQALLASVQLSTKDSDTNK